LALIAPNLQKVGPWVTMSDGWSCNGRIILL